METGAARAPPVRARHTWAGGGVSYNIKRQQAPRRKNAPEDQLSFLSTENGAVPRLEQLGGRIGGGKMAGPRGRNTDQPHNAQSGLEAPAHPILGDCSRCWPAWLVPRPHGQACVRSEGGVGEEGFRLTFSTMQETRGAHKTICKCSISQARRLSRGRQDSLEASRRVAEAWHGLAHGSARQSISEAVENASLQAASRGYAEVSAGLLSGSLSLRQSLEEYLGLGMLSKGARSSSDLSQANARR